MTSSQTRAGRVTRVVTLLAVLFAAVAVVPTVATATPAYAAQKIGGGGSVDDGGPGNNGGGGFTINDGRGSGGCSQGQLWASATQKAFDGPYHSCVGKPLATANASFTEVLCMTGFEVYRFYGTVANPTGAVVRSQLNNSSDCATEASYRFATTSPYDSGQLGNLQTAGTGAGARLQPWHTTGPGVNPDSASIAAYEAPGALWYTTPVWRWTADPGYTGKLTDGVTAALVNGNCAAQQTPNNYAKDLADPSVPDAEKQTIRALLWQAYEQLLGDGATVPYSLQEMGMASFTRNGKTVDSSALVKNADGTYPDNFAIAWSSTPCASPFDYVATTADPNAGGSTLTGVCYIPTMRSGREYKVKDGGEVTSWVDWSSISSPWEMGGLRYSTYYAGTRGTANNEDVGISGLTQDSANAIGQKWRSAMVADYSNRVGGGKALYNTTGGHQTQNAPGQPYVNEFSKNFSAKSWNVKAAEDALYSDAHCAFGDHVSWVAGGNKTAVPQVSQTINVQTPAAFQVGGLLREQTVTATAGPLLCNGTACGTTNRERMLHYTLGVTGLNGYRQCAPGQTYGCDFAVLTPPTVLTGPKDVQKTQSMTLIFYNPTMPTQDVKVTLSGVAATYEHDWSITTPHGMLTGMTGDPIEIKSQVVTGTDVILYAPTVTGAPKTVPVIGASALPSH